MDGYGGCAYGSPNKSIQARAIPRQPYQVIEGALVVVRMGSSQTSCIQRKVDDYKNVSTLPSSQFAKSHLVSKASRRIGA